MLGLFVRQLRRELDEKSPKKMTLSAVVSAPNAHYQHVDALYDVRALRASLDWITVAAYDLHDPRSFPVHHSPIQLLAGVDGEYGGSPNGDAV
jgi:GH18 family chitinase